MYFCTIASGSSGNCTFVSAMGTNILIDAGISMKRTLAALGEFGKSPEDISGILITHDHSDHIAGLGTISRRHRIPVYMSEASADKLIRRSICAEDTIHTFPAGESFMLGSIKIQSFRTPHDTAGSVGFRLDCRKESLALVTDLGYMPDSVMQLIGGTDVVVLEANHDVSMLKNGPYPSFLKRRILGEEGHLSNETAAQCAVELAKRGTKRIVLAHLSRENNLPSLALETVQSALDKAGYCCAVRLDVAPRERMSKVCEVGLC